MANKEYDIIVVGGGHAGIEAALIAARMHAKTALISLSIDNIGKMPCNPSVGGPAKGIVVREIDALGGQMGITADKTALQFKMLNTTKGPGVQCLRVQSDKIAYKKMMQDVVCHQKDLDVIEGIVEQCLFEDKKIVGVKMGDGTIINSKITILTTGTYMASNIMISDEVTNFGPDNEPTTKNLSQSLRDAGLKTFRLKTGTPPRVLTSSIDFSKTSYQPGSDEFVCFSDTTEDILPFDKQVPCYLTYTNAKTHEIIFNNLHRSSMYSGVVKGVGPRYCPSIEDKIVRFADKERHQLFLEPESIYYDEWYLQGFSTSMPRDVQEKMVHSLHGLENAVISKYAYAIEYDAIDAMQIKPSLETKIISGLFTAGQINGTSGYEEAAGQGLVAGINASLKLDNKEAMVLKRSSAYIGVLIDDLVTKGITDPYRMLTSRAEFRLLLRHDNADERLTPIGYEVGSVSKEKYNNYLNKKNNINKLKEILTNNNLVMNEEVKEKFIENNLDVPKKNMKFIELLKRPEISIDFLANFIDISGFTNEEKEEVTIEVKYEGYIKKEYEQKEKLLKMESKQIPKDIDYNKVKNIASEARQKLSLVKPETIAQASRISGVNPVDISLLLIYLKKEYNKND